MLFWIRSSLWTTARITCQPLTLEAQDESDLSSDEEGGDESEYTEPESVVERSSTTSVSSDGPGYVARTKQDAVNAEHDFDQEKLGPSPF